MTCRGCGRALDTEARFCPGCGMSVDMRCAGCGSLLAPDARFCKQCGRAVDGTPPAAGGTRVSDHDVVPIVPLAPASPLRERKVATLLFADIVGFTGLTEAHDPEIISSVVAPTFERLSREVERYEGTIEKFAGDALLAVFGVPTIHEDDPERAVRAALEMQAAMSDISAAAAAGGRPDLRLRIGIETGEVLVDLTRARDTRDLFVTGDAVNTAARLQAAAEPGTIVVGPSTYAASRDIVEYRELTALKLRGKSAPVAAWQAISVKARRGGRRTPLGIESPLVGRDNELTLLKDTVRRAVEEGRPHLVTIIGSAGVGKSRLAWELEKYVDGLPELYNWRKGRCLAYSAQSFGPLADVVKADARIHDDEAPEAARAKLVKRLDELPIAAGDAPAIRDALEAVLALGEQRERPRDELFEAWRRYLGAVAADDPLVLVMEDIHWADDVMLSFLDFLARWAEGPLVMLCLARHELLETWPSWGGGLPNALTVFLEPLAASATARLMEGLLAGGVPGSLRDRIVALSEGNPLFAEEMVRMLVDRGVLRYANGRWELASDVESLEIPGSVQAVLAARLDTLPAEEKRIAQDAAVVGRIFWDIVVAHLAGTGRSSTDELIRRLRVKDIVVQRKPSSLAEASEYGFRHVLIRDVAYDSLPKRDRSRLHRDIALWAEAELSDRIEEFSELIASHLAAALAYEEEFALDDDGELREIRVLAREAALRAARRAAAISQVAAAGRWLKLAVDLAGKLREGPRAAAALADEYAAVAWESSHPSERHAILSAAIEGMLAIPDLGPEDQQLLARLRDAEANALYEMGDVEGARRLVREGIAALEPGPPSPGRALLLGRLGWTYWRGGPVEEAVPLLERAIDEAQTSADASTLRWVTHDLGVALSFLERRDEAVTLLEESLHQATEAGDRGLLLRCYINLPAVRLGRGDPPGPLVDMVEEGLRLARRAAASHTASWLAGNLAEIRIEMGRLDDGLEFLDEAVRDARIVSSPYLANALCERAMLHRLRGELDEAERDLAEAESLGVSPEPQVASVQPLALAWSRWPQDPRGAMEGLAAWVFASPRQLGPRPAAANELARMALRLSDADTLAGAIESYRLRRTVTSAPVFLARDQWIEGLSGSGDHKVVERAAAVLEELGYRVSAVDAWTDAALLAARAGAASDAQRRAIALCEQMSLYPLLGRPPEERWLQPEPAGRRTAGTGRRTAGTGRRSAGA